MDATKSRLIDKAQFSKRQLISFAVIFGLVAGYMLLRSFAANPNLPADLNNDNTVNVSDLSILLGAYGTTNATADINADGLVNVLDLSILLSHYGQSISAKPSIPTGLTATPGNGKVTLNWSANPASQSVDTYQVYLNDTNNNLSVSGTTYTVSGLANGTSYTFRVSAHNGAGYGDWSAAITATPVGSGTPPPAPPPPGPPPPPGSGNGIGVIEEGSNFSYAVNPGRYSMIIVSQSDASAACAVPSPTRSLVYQAGVDVNKNYSNGVDWSTANNNGWLLKDSSGNLLVNQGYTSNSIGDVGSSAYQQAWISGVTSFLNANHCKGVFIDDVLRDIKPLTGVYPAKYPSQSAWQAAMASFASVVGPALKANGIYVAVNAAGYTSGDGNSNDGTLDVSWWQQVGPYVSGLMAEYYDQTSEGNFTLRLSGTSSYTQNWDGWQRLIGTAQNMSRDFIGLTFGSSNTDYKTMRYGKGSFLMEWNGGSSVFIYSPAHAPLSTVDPWNLAWTTDMGKPKAAKTQVGSAWKRLYDNGEVIVNPSGSTVTVDGHSVASGDAYIGP